MKSRNSICEYRTEFYLQQREQESQSQAPVPTSTMTTWKDLMQQKRINEHDQAEIDRVLSTIDSIHDSLNRSLIIPYSRAYSALYGDQDESHQLIRSFCQRRDHCKHYSINCRTYTKFVQSIFGFTKCFQDSDLDDEVEHRRPAKENTCDSGYGSVINM